MGLLSILFGRRDKSPELDVHPDADDLDDMFPQEPADPDFVLAGTRIGVAYRDERGLKTKRVVRLKRLDAREIACYVHGFCELRQDDRTFRVDRMAAIYDPGSGELLESAEDYFRPYIERALHLEEQIKGRSKYGQAWELIRRLKDELSVLILVARADNRFAKTEQSLILRYAAERAKDLGIKITDDNLVVLAKWVKLQDPSEPEVRVSVKAVAKTAGALDGLWEVSEIIAEADGKVKPDEVQALAEIKKAIGALVAS